MTRLIETETATYEQRAAGSSNSGAGLTEYRTIRVAAWNGTQGVTDWVTLVPEQGEPFAGDRWLIRSAHGRYVLTDVVVEVQGEL